MVLRPGRASPRSLGGARAVSVSSKYLARATAQDLRDLDYVLLIDPGQYAGGQMSCDMQLNAGSLLAIWLATNPSAHLVVISGSQVTQQDNSKGIQQIYFNPIRAASTARNHLRGRVLTCNYSIKHDPEALYASQYWIAHQIGSSTGSCPVLNYRGVKYYPPKYGGWHP
jgi:hypothetical protein